MTPAASATGWPHEGPARCARWVVVALGLPLVALYLASTFLLWSLRLPPLTATPWTVVQYGYHHGGRPDVRRKLAASLAAGATLALGGAALALLPRRRALYGDARFARRAEIRAAGLLGDAGILLGRYGRRYLMLPGQQGVLLEAPPRSGKGVGVVVPNLLNWPGSVIVNDIKGENWMRTAGWRAAHGHEVHLFDPLSELDRSSRWNPLAYVSDVPYRCIDDLQRIASMLYPDPVGSDPFWTSSARSLFLGIALYLFQTEGTTRTVGTILREGMASDAEGFQKHWRRVIDSCERAGYPLSQEAVQSLYDVIDLAPVTASSIRKTFTSRLDLWMNPLIDAATSGNDFDFRALRRRPIAIYTRINPDNIARLQPLLNLFYQQAIGLQTRELPEHNPALKHQVLVVLDEFPSLGRIPVIADATAFLPGYNVRPLVIVQSMSQVVDKYGHHAARALRKMLAARIVFAPAEFEDAEALSKELGNRTVTKRSTSWQRFSGRPPSVTLSEEARPLLLPQEVKELGPRRLLIFYEGLRPILGQRVFYFREPQLARREQAPPPVPPLQIAPMRRGSGPPAPDDDGPGLQPADCRVSLEPDVAQLDTLALEDFSLDFADVDVPAGRPMTDDEVHAAVDRFLDSLNE